MKKIITFVICSFLLLPIFALAAECDNKEIVRLKTEASKVEAKLVPISVKKTGIGSETGEKIEYDGTIFELVISNLNFNDFNYDLTGGDLSWDSTKDGLPEDNTYSKVIYNGYEEIRTLYLDIYPKDTNCSTKAMNSLKIIIPMNNPYHFMNACDGIQEFYMCQEYIYDTYTSANLTKETERYRKSEIDKSGKKKQKVSFITGIKNFIVKYRIPLIVSSVLIVGAVVALIIRRRIIMKKHFG